MLQQAAHSAENRALAKAGEIAIVRANQTKSENEFEKRLAAVQKMHADEVARHKAEIESARAERQRVETENLFLEHDAQDVQRTRNIPSKVPRVDAAQDPLQASPVTTPKKNRIKSFGDGFEDDEVVMLSPSKLVIRSKVGTPKAGAKRKRKQKDENPIPKLRLSQSKENSPNKIPEEDPLKDEVSPLPAISPAFVGPSRTRKQEDPRFKVRFSSERARVAK